MNVPSAVILLEGGTQVSASLAQLDRLGRPHHLRNFISEVNTLHLPFCSMGILRAVSKEIIKDS